MSALAKILVDELVAEVERTPELRDRLRKVLGVDAVSHVPPPEYLYLS